MGLPIGEDLQNLCHSTRELVEDDEITLRFLRPVLSTSVAGAVQYTNPKNPEQYSYSNHRKLYAELAVVFHGDKRSD